MSCSENPFMRLIEEGKKRLKEIPLDYSSKDSVREVLGVFENEIVLWILTILDSYDQKDWCEEFFIEFNEIRYGVRDKESVVAKHSLQRAIMDCLHQKTQQGTSVDDHYTYLPSVGVSSLRVVLIRNDLFVSK